ncbi:MAG: hypothetical protein U0P45_13035 [Acidimicrobiales bacterium]
MLLVNRGYSYGSDLLDRLVGAFPGASGVEVGDDEIITFDDVPAERLPIARRFEQAAEVRSPRSTAG